MFQLLYADLRGFLESQLVRDFVWGEKVGGLVDGVTWVAPIAEKNWATWVFSALEVEIWAPTYDWFFGPTFPKSLGEFLFGD